MMTIVEAEIKKMSSDVFGKLIVMGVTCWNPENLGPKPVTSAVISPSVVFPLSFSGTLFHYSLVSIQF